MTSLKLLYVVGARPNFMKVAPILQAIAKRASSVEQVLVHTGQHFDSFMSEVFFRELELPAPDYHLSVAGGSHADQTARVMLGVEPIIKQEKPDWVVVVGDVNSTVATALTAAKIGVPVAHVEAGLRSGDVNMPEEVNRKVTDAVAALLLTPSRDADENLIREGVARERIRFVGNVMIDTLVRMLPSARSKDVLRRMNLRADDYVLATLHRPSNVDDPQTLGGLLRGLSQIARQTEVVLPIHPRTRDRLAQVAVPSNLRIIDPLGYCDFLCMTDAARAVVTDSGGLQEETTYLGVPCLTVRRNTERPVTITEGTNRLIDPSEKALVEAWRTVPSKFQANASAPELWDGRAAERIAANLLA